jgi:hypothetical protein
MDINTPNIRTDVAPRTRKADTTDTQKFAFYITDMV